MNAASSNKRGPAFPGLAGFRKRYPLTVTNFGALSERESWLKRVWELDARWQEAMERGEETAKEVVMRGAPPAGVEVEDSFDIIYAGGVLGLLHAAVMACRHNRRVMVFDLHTVGRTHRDWNISDEELTEFERAGLFTKSEIEAAVMNRYTGGFVKFHDRASRVKTPPLWINNVLDTALSADKLLELACAKIKSNAPDACRLLNGLRFVRAYVEPHRVTIEVEETNAGDGGGKRRWFDARLFVDATGTNSPVSRQLNGGQSITHVCPTVGTAARGFVRGKNGDAADVVDFSVGEILVSTADASDHRQLIWEGFAGDPRADEYTTYLFFYDRLDSPADKSLLALFERYFESLPDYKRPGRQWRVVKPVFGYIPSVHTRGFSKRKRTADDRVLTIGDAAGLSSPLTFCGFGSHVRNLRRLTEMTNRALEADALDQNSLARINAYEPRVAQMASLAEFMRPTPKSEPSTVNETMNAVMAALHEADERVRRELFQDRMSFGALKELLSRTARLYPRIFQRLREHLGARGTLWWLAGIGEAVWHERRERASSESSPHSTGSGDQESQTLD